MAGGGWQASVFVLLRPGRAALEEMRSTSPGQRLAGRPQDLADLRELEAIHGPLPIRLILGLDVDAR